jgi:hypothetical protein
MGNNEKKNQKIFNQSHNIKALGMYHGFDSVVLGRGLLKNNYRVSREYIFRCLSIPPSTMKGYHEAKQVMGIVGKRLGRLSSMLHAGEAPGVL